MRSYNDGKAAGASAAYYNAAKALRAAFGLPSHYGLPPRKTFEDALHLAIVKWREEPNAHTNIREATEQEVEDFDDTVEDISWWMNELEKAERKRRLSLEIASRARSSARQQSRLAESERQKLVASLQTSRALKEAALNADQALSDAVSAHQLELARAYQRIRSLERELSLKNAPFPFLRALRAPFRETRPN